MYLAVIGPHYVLWHYTHGCLGYFRVWWNIVWATARVFSLRLMLRTLLAPWKRMLDTPQNKWDIGEQLSVIIINLLSRLLGFVIRVGVLLVGSSITLLIAGAGALGFLGWLVAPLLFLVLLFQGGAFLLTALL